MKCYYWPIWYSQAIFRWRKGVKARPSPLPWPPRSNEPLCNVESQPGISTLRNVHPTSLYQWWEDCSPIEVRWNDPWWDVGCCPWKDENVGFLHTFSPFVTEVLTCRRYRYNIPSSEKQVTNRPYLFVFDRLQVVGDEMDGWDNTNHSPSTNLASASKKRRFEMNTSSHPAPKCYGTSYDKDVEI